MILFVLEGAKMEKRVFETIKSLYFENTNENIIYILQDNIYSLYNRVQDHSLFGNIEGAADVISILRDIHPDTELTDVDSSEISQIFLFFDYDFQHVFQLMKGNSQKDIMTLLKEDNLKIEKMLRLFNDETEMGKLYINYPMIESLMYTKKMPDGEYNSYVVTLDDCHGKFKKKAENFTDYHGYAGLLLNEKNSHMLCKNWKSLISQNVMKANSLCIGKYEIPLSKDDITQDKIFSAQVNLYDTYQRIGILNSFPLFVYDYFKELDI